MNKDCTFLLSSYDGGEDLWEGFFKALSVQWPEMDMRIVLNTEKKHYSFPGYTIESFEPCKNKEMTWAERLVDTLKHIDTEYTLLFLEDFWLDDKVDDEFFRKTLEWMKENPDVANFSYYPCLPGTNIDDGKYERFELRPQKCEYKFNCQVGLWRPKELIGFFRLHEDPWEWEIFGSMRAGRCKQSFYSLKGDAPLVFSYGDNLTGCIIHRGKWVKDAVIPLAEKYGLEIDYSKRGFEDFDEFWKNVNASFWEKLMRGDLFGRLFRKINKQYRKYLSLRKIDGEL